MGEMGNKLRAAKEFLEYTPEYEHAWDSWPRSEHLAEDQKHHLETAAAIDRLMQAEGLVGRTDELSVAEVVRLYAGKDGLLHALFQIAQSQDDPRAGEAAYTLGRIYMDKEQAESLKIATDWYAARVCMSQALRKGYEKAREAYVELSDGAEQYAGAAHWVSKDTPIGRLKERFYRAFVHLAVEHGITNPGLDEQYLVPFPKENACSQRFKELKEKLIDANLRILSANEAAAQKAQKCIGGDVSAALEQLVQKKEQFDRSYARFRKALIVIPIAVVLLQILALVLSLLPGVVGMAGDVITAVLNYPLPFLLGLLNGSVYTLSQAVQDLSVMSMSDGIGIVVSDVLFALIFFLPARGILSIGQRKRRNRKFNALKRKLVRKLRIEEAAEFAGELQAQTLPQALVNELKEAGIPSDYHSVNQMMSLQFFAAANRRAADMTIKDLVCLAKNFDGRSTWTPRYECPRLIRQVFGCGTEEEYLLAALRVANDPHMANRLELAWELLLAGLHDRIKEMYAKRSDFRAKAFNKVYTNYRYVIRGRTYIEDVAEYIHAYVHAKENQEPLRSALVLAQGILINLTETCWRRLAAAGDAHALYIMARCEPDVYEKNAWFQKAMSKGSREMAIYAATHGDYDLSYAQHRDCAKIAWESGMPEMERVYKYWDERDRKARVARAEAFSAQQAEKNRAMSAYKDALDQKERDFNLWMSGDYSTIRERFGAGEIPADVFTLLDSLRDQLENDYEQKLNHPPRTTYYDV